MAEISNNGPKDVFLLMEPCGVEMYSSCLTCAGAVTFSFK